MKQTRTKVRVENYHLWYTFKYANDFHQEDAEMATMIPPDGPRKLNSQAEKEVYYALKNQLPDRITVIHSLAWLSSFVAKQDSRRAAIGEVDFIILDPQYGMLCLEVKGGRWRNEGGKFINSKGESIFPVQQVWNSIIALGRGLNQKLFLNLRIGYAVLLPHCSVQDKQLPLWLYDSTIPGDGHSLCLDMHDMRSLENSILEALNFWKKATSSVSLGEELVQKIITTLSPEDDYTPDWAMRILDDYRQWLVLTPQQKDVLEKALSQKRMVVGGLSGTGKTIVAIEYAKSVASGADERVLFVVYNVLLQKWLESVFSNIQNVQVESYYELCRKAYQNQELPIPQNEKLWKEGPLILSDYLKQIPNPYAALIIDESQIFKSSWLEDFSSWFEGKRILACCDPKQVFSFEEALKFNEVVDAIEADRHLVLTVNLRSPKIIFDRLDHTIQPPYQQQSPRTLFEDELSETNSFYPYVRLKEIVSELKESNVRSEDIVLLYTKSEPELTEFKDYVGDPISVYKYRGLESPIVILWVSGPVEDTSLIIGYSRATTRCIVIYSGDYSESPSEFFKFVPHTLLKPKVFYEVEAELIDKSTQIANSFLFWLPDWNGWYLPASKLNNLEASLWAMALTKTDSPCYRLHVSDRAQLYLSVTMIHSIIDIGINFCEFCNSWSRSLFYEERGQIFVLCCNCHDIFQEEMFFSNEKRTCDICNQTRSGWPVSFIQPKDRSESLFTCHRCLSSILSIKNEASVTPTPELDDFEEAKHFSAMVNDPSQFTRAEKKSLLEPIFMLTYFKNALNDSQRIIILEEYGLYDRKLHSLDLVRLYIVMEVVRLQEGEEITRQALLEKLCSRFGTDRKKSMEASLAGRISVLIRQRKWIKKVKKGVYIRQKI